MNRVRGNIGIAFIESDTDDDKIMDMVKIVAYHIFSDVGVDTTDDKVARGAVVDLDTDMCGEVKLALTPRSFDLKNRLLANVFLGFDVYLHACQGYKDRVASRGLKIPVRQIHQQRRHWPHVRVF